MDKQIIVSGPKANRIYSCARCSYQAKRAYNVQRHLVQHFEKPPKELQHICVFAGCSFSTLRWDNLNRHIRRVHGVTRQIAEEDSATVTQDAEPGTGSIEDDLASILMEEDPSSVPSEEHPASVPCEEYPGLVSNENYPASMPSEEHLASVPSEEPLASVPSDEPQASVPSDEDLAFETSEERPASMPSYDDEDSVTVPSDEIPASPHAGVRSKAKPTQKRDALKKQKQESKTEAKINGGTKRKYKNGKYKIYECLKCSYRTNRGYNIKRHLAKHTEPLVLHVCIISGCGFSTPRWDNLCRHVKRIHPDSVEPEEFES